MTQSEREQRVRAFAAKLNFATKHQLLALKQDIAIKMARGFSPIGDAQGDLEALQALYKRLETLSQAEPSPAEQLQIQAKTLADEYGVSIKVAQNYITKNHVKKAPPIEESEANQTTDNNNENAEELSRGRYHPNH
jgi:hypothetical protein